VSHTQREGHNERNTCWRGRPRCLSHGLARRATTRVSRAVRRPVRAPLGLARAATTCLARAARRPRRVSHGLARRATTRVTSAVRRPRCASSEQHEGHERGARAVRRPRRVSHARCEGHDACRTGGARATTCVARSPCTESPSPVSLAESRGANMAAIAQHLAEGGGGGACAPQSNGSHPLPPPPLANSDVGESPTPSPASHTTTRATPRKCASRVRQAHTTTLGPTIFDLVTPATIGPQHDADPTARHTPSLARSLEAYLERLSCESRGAPPGLRVCILVSVTTTNGMRAWADVGERMPKMWPVVAPLTRRRGIAMSAGAWGIKTPTPPPPPRLSPRPLAIW
jgi:hypothetical protein